MQIKNNTLILTQINDTLKVLSGLFGREVTLEELVEFGEGKTSTSRQLPKVNVKTTTRTYKKAVPKPLTTADGRFTKSLKKVRPESGDIVVNAKWVARRYRYEGTPTVEQMMDGVVLFLNFTDPVVVRKFKLHLRGLANPNGFGIEIKHLAYNRIEVKLGDKKPAKGGLKPVK